MSSRSQDIKKTLKSDLLLLLTAAIWGMAFVAQREGAGNIHPLLFIAIRYILGAASLLPVILFVGRKERRISLDATEKSNPWKEALAGGLSMGTVLFFASYLQQEALIVATAGKAGFITSLYVVLVPVFGILTGKHKLNPVNATGLMMAVAGLYLLSVEGDFVIASADIILICCAFLYSIHIILIDHFSGKAEPLYLSVIQFMVAGIWGVLASLLFRIDVSWNDIQLTAMPLLYTGIFSSGVAYTLQIFAQRHAQASHAAIIMSSESVFAAVGGVLILSEVIQGRAIIGAIFMFVAGVISQLASLSSQGFFRKTSFLDE